MKCGMELLAITKEAERLKELRRLEEQAEAERLMQVRKKETIQWCDTVLSEYLEKLALRENYHSIIFHGNLLHLLK